MKDMGIIGKVFKQRFTRLYPNFFEILIKYMLHFHAELRRKKNISYLGSCNTFVSKSKDKVVQGRSIP